MHQSTSVGLRQKQLLKMTLSSRGHTWIKIGKWHYIGSWYGHESKYDTSAHMNTKSNSENDISFHHGGTTGALAPPSLSPFEWNQEKFHVQRVITDDFLRILTNPDEFLKIDSTSNRRFNGFYRASKKCWKIDIDTLKTIYSKWIDASSEGHLQEIY